MPQISIYVLFVTFSDLTVYIMKFPSVKNLGDNVIERISIGRNKKVTGR
jgi:hypothetical protein